MEEDVYRKKAFSLKTFRYKGRKHHLVALVRDEDRYILVTKWYGVHQQWWHYNTFLVDDWVEYAVSGLIKDIKVTTDKVIQNED